MLLIKSFELASNEYAVIDGVRNIMSLWLSAGLLPFNLFLVCILSLKIGKKFVTLYSFRSKCLVCAFLHLDFLI